MIWYDPHFNLAWRGEEKEVLLHSSRPAFSCCFATFVVIKIQHYCLLYIVLLQKQNHTAVFLQRCDHKTQCNSLITATIQRKQVRLGHTDALVHQDLIPSIGLGQMY